MKTFTTESKSEKKYFNQKKNDEVSNKQPASSELTHDDIARRAYEIYLINGRRPGQSEKNWHEAEHELRNKKLEKAI